MAESVTRTTISLPPELAKRAEERVQKLGYKSFSEYVSFLISADVKARPLHSTTRDEKGVRYQSQSQSQSLAVAEDPPKKK